MLMASGLTVASAAFDATTFGNTTIEVAAKISIARIAFVVLRPDAVLNFTLFHLCKILYPVLIRATFLHLRVTPFSMLVWHQSGRGVPTVSARCSHLSQRGPSSRCGMLVRFAGGSVGLGVCLRSLLDDQLR